MKSKKSMSLSWTLLVLATLVLVITALFYMGFKKDEFDNKIYSVSAFEDIYSSAKILDFYLKHMVEKIDKNNPVSSFASELEKYKFKDGKYFLEEFKNIKSQIDDKHIIVVDGKLNIHFYVNFTKEVYYKEGKPALYNVTYTHVFSYDE